jgi:tRNA 5-methylaminomethyl-2-thiouridine biosynthesis bifunctional protein
MVPMLRRAMSRPRPKFIAVIGAGLAGAACANTAALAGMQVTVFEQAALPAAGASGVPLALFAPSVSADDANHSRLLRHGVHLLLAQLRRLSQLGLLCEGSDWAMTGVVERCIRTEKKLPKLWQEPQDPPALQSRLLARHHPVRPTELLHGAAGWVNPARLVAAWLAHDNINLRLGANLNNLNDACLSPFDVVLVAAGAQTAALCVSLRTQLQPIRGQVEWGEILPGVVAVKPDRFAGQHPINGMGHWIQGAGRWLAGATFQRDETSLIPRAKDADLNFEKLAVLMPECDKEQLAELKKIARSWVGVRVAQKNRTPLIERLEPTPNAAHANLWVCTGLGSRGVSLASWCAKVWLDACE